MVLNYKNLLKNLHISFFMTFIILMLLVFCFYGVVQAENILIEEKSMREQEQLENEIHLEWDDLETDSRRFFSPKANLGFHLGILRFYLSDLNFSLRQENLPVLRNTMIIRGIQGQAGAARGHRIGVFITGGELKNSAGERQTLLNYNHRGLFYLQGIYSDRKADIALGMGLGRTGLRLTTVHQKPERDIYGEPTSNIYNASFLVFQPRLDLQYKILPLTLVNIGLESFLGVGYSGWYSHGYSTKIPPVNNFFSFGISASLSLGF